MKPSLGKDPFGTVAIDVDRILRSRVLITAMSGGGKSWALRRLLEQTGGAVQQIVLDPEGEFYTLREHGDYLLAGEGGEVPAEPRSAKLLGRKLIETKVSAIVDLSHLSLSDQRRYVREFIGGLMTASRKASTQAIVVLDEAHKFAPEAGASESLSAVVDLMSAGRKRGLAGVLATQRLSKLHKDAAAEAGSLLVGLSQLDIDVRRAGDLVGFATKADLQRIRTLNADGGEFFFVGPAWVSTGDGTRNPLKVGPVKSTHPSAGAAAPPVPPTPAAIAAIASSLAELPKEAAREEIDLAAARERIRILEREARAREAEPGAISAEAQRQIEDHARKAGQREAWAAAGKRLAQVKIETMSHLKAETAHLVSVISKVLVDFPMEPDEVEVGAAHGTGPSNPRALGEARASARPSGVDRTSATAMGRTAGEPQATSSPRRPSPGSTEAQARDLCDGPMQKVVDALAWLEAMGVPDPYPRTQVGFVAGYRQSGGFRNTLSKLKTAGFIEYPTQGTLILTREGRMIAAVPSITSKADVRERALELCDGPMAKLLNALIELGPDGQMTRADLAAATGYEQSGGFRNTLSKLKTAGMIRYPNNGVVATTDVLWP